MNKYIFYLFIFSFSFFSFRDNLFAAKTCSRNATINYQKILIDTNTTQKGEGLRYYIQKDPVAKSLLDKYQNGTKIKWPNVALGTLGTLLTFTGIIIKDKDNINNTKTMLIGGISLLIVNFLVAKTLAYANEENLRNAIREYNKRNLPRIYFDPGSQGEQNKLYPQSKVGPMILIELVRSF